MHRDDGPTAGDVSFDPKTWVASGATEPPMTVTRPAPSRRSPGRVAAGLSALLLAGGAGAAWLGRAPGIAPATAIAAPVMAVAPQVQAVNASRRTLVLAGAEQIEPTLASSGLPADVAAGAARAATVALGKASGDIRLVIDLVGPENARRLTRLQATRDDGAGLLLAARPDGSFTQTTLQAKLVTEVRVVRGEMDATSFYNAAVTAGITDSLVSDFATAFSFDFDFQREVKPGDIFEAAFEQKVNPSGDAVGPPTLVYVSLSTKEKSKALYRFLAPGDTQPGWYDGNGRSTVTALMRTPVDGARISSQFGFRLHPILGFMKLHKGTDFAAPIGTPIFAAGSGVVEWAAMKGPNGNLTIIRHDNGWQTYYLHQSMFMPGIVPGARVAQGQQIGAIGTTGRSTGPHLHYEVHIDGQPVNPMEIDTGTGRNLTGDVFAQFRKERDRIDVSRAAPVS